MDCAQTTLVVQSFGNLYFLAVAANSVVLMYSARVQRILYCQEGDVKKVPHRTRCRLDHSVGQVDGGDDRMDLSLFLVVLDDTSEQVLYASECDSVEFRIII